ncbi:MAG: DUF1013 domain-containing protein [Alphaproteobacteria bacterium]|nr:DUF1013 domain-containing protein [Alphaproteobacteria bacterium]
MSRPLMPKATAVWLIDNTTLSFDQIADFCSLHPLEVKGIADGDVAQGIKGMDPVAAGQVTREEIERCEKDPKARLKLIANPLVDQGKKRKGPRYTPVSRRQDRPDAIAWLLRHHPELSDAQIGRLVGTTKPTIQSIRDRSHWNATNIKPLDPVTLGLCSQIELDEAVRKANASKSRSAEGKATPELLKPVAVSLAVEAAPEDAAEDPRSSAAPTAEDVFGTAPPAADDDADDADDEDAGSGWR